MLIEQTPCNDNRHDILSRSNVQRRYFIKSLLDLTLNNQNNIGILVYCITYKLFLKIIHN